MEVHICNNNLMFSFFFIDFKPHPWELLLSLFLYSDTNPSIVKLPPDTNQEMDKEKEILIKIVNPKLVAQIWGQIVGNPKYTYRAFADLLR